MLDKKNQKEIEKDQKMSKIPNFDKEQRAFVIHCLQRGGTIAQVTDDIIEMFQLDLSEDTNVRETIYRRLQKIKARLSDDQIPQNGEAEQIDLLCRSPQWRIMYFRCLLKRAKDDKTKAQLLRDIRTETRQLAKMEKTDSKTTLTEPDELLQENNHTSDWEMGFYDPRCVPEDIKSLPNFIPREWHRHGFTNGPYPNDCLRETFLPKSEYEFVYDPDAEPEHQFDKPRHPYCKRKADDVLVWENGIPLTEKELETGKQQYVEKSEAESENEAMRIEISDDCDEPARSIYLENYRKKHGMSS